MKNQNRILIAAVKSGSGKTLFTCGLLELLKKQYSLRAHKCGPDYIDPMFHRTVLGIEGTNLDPFFSDAEDLKKTLSEDNTEISVIEGAMGIYDGITGMGKTGSCYDVAVKTETPVLLLVDAAGSGNTILSVVKGILLDDSEQMIKGIVFNRMSGMYLKSLEPDLKRMLISIKREDISVLGAIPKAKGVQFESRHLGLVMPEEVEGLLEQITSFAALIEENLDMERLLAIAGKAAPLDEVNDQKTGEDRNLTLAVARDEAFCFYYEQNIRAFTDRGVKIRYFSPIRDEHLPEGCSGILLGGGYPELFLKQLAENETMKNEIRNAIVCGMPSLAECGGFMYLGEYIEDENGTRYPMTGIVQGGAHNTGKLNRFGYVTVAPQKPGLLQNPVRGHEFHYFDMDDAGADCKAEKPGTGKTWNCMYMGNRHLWGYPHLYYPSCPELVDAFVKEMRSYRQRCSG